MIIDDILARVSKPSRYLGNEYNIVVKDWDEVELKMALAFPDLYEIGMSHQGLKILYNIINQRKDCLAERVYTPDTDFEKILREAQTPLFSLESHRALADFDVLGITLPYELCYTNILTILDLAGIPFYSVERDDKYPLIIGGGPCAFHPEPVADFFDAILLGDGEEAVQTMADYIIEAKRKGFGRKQMLDGLSEIPGMYVPSFFKPVYDQDGNLLEIKNLKPGYSKVKRAILADLDAVTSEAAPLVPLTKIVHDRLGLEVARGCTRGCRFCQAGIIYRPVRERHPKKIMELAKSGIEKGGFEEMALLSLSTGDYSCLSGVLTAMMDAYADKNVSMSLPSMRVGTLTQEIMEQIKRVRKTGFTIAPEAGSERLRRIINKGITQEDLLQTCKASFELGWKIIKLYFMCGLPMETEQDLEEIPALLQKALDIAGRGGGRKINASIGVFVPKPHTPFQWEPQLTVDEGFERIFFLKKRVPKSATLKWNDPKLSFLEGVFSRGDRRLAGVIEKAWRNGARLDAWTEHFNLELWRQTGIECGIDLASYLRRRSHDEILPWEHLDAGVDADFLLSELEKAKKEEYTPDCRVHGCQKCGLCDFKKIKPVVHKSSELPAKELVSGEKSNHSLHRDQESDSGHFYYLIKYARLKNARFLGHLELLQAFFRAIRRAELPINFSQGYHPTPKVSFGPALSVGTESLAEFIIVDVFRPLTNLNLWQKRLNDEMPENISVKEITISSKGLATRIVTEYKINLGFDVNRKIIADFMSSDSHKITVSRKKRRKTIDVRPIVESIQFDDGHILLSLITETSLAGCKPIELVANLFDIPAAETWKVRILKTGFRELS